MNTLISCLPLKACIAAEPVSPEVAPRTVNFFEACGRAYVNKLPKN
jgi:hypothetical protein